MTHAKNALLLLLVLTLAILLAHAGMGGRGMWDGPI
jgi:hypothetical protein